MGMVMNGGGWNGVRILSTESVQEIRRSQIPGIEGGQGLIWYRFGFHGRSLVGHNGGDQGVATVAFFEPATGIGVAVLGNSNWRKDGNRWPLQEIMQRLFEDAPRLLEERSVVNEAAQPSLYSELAPWFHLLTSPDDYGDEAAQALSLFTESLGEPPTTILELGSGGGNNASHMKAHATLTLTDLSPEMLELSRSLNPECEHIQGDMTTLRLDRTFDGVFVHDAVSYLTTEEQLRAAIETAFVHTRPGGAAIFCPDHVRERFRETTDHGGHDGKDGDPRSLRYLQWTWDPDPDDTLVRRRHGLPASRGHRRTPGGARPTRARPVPARHLDVAARRRRLRSADADLHVDRGWRRRRCRDFPGVPTPLNLAKQHLANRAVGGPR